MSALTAPDLVLSATEVAFAIGIEPHDLPKLHPDDFGCPGHWRLNKHSVVVYTPKGIRGLLAVLRDRPPTEENEIAVKSLEVALAQLEATPARTLSSAPREHWFKSGQMA